ncbi:Uma2 family endonuclease [Anabaena subtropica]|uniref:Uma2 family endonuclease n=1 Tax=Anabaena subtropica FACHB-260 TaxID=2692884 RepID=A0ABR8CV87_9NOST|nr:Uma2 family endonuclease [Anabaena subtropica]MBD2346438.1 Uma2 family endonuclease [Anabaena subtropica FACHB-260]
MVITPNTASEVIYPESDGQPMADNTKQFRWIVTIKENLEISFAGHPDVFIAGDLFWYPVAGNPNIKQAPDTLVVFGRPKGDRGSYKQWEEDNIPPQVVFEILSPGNKTKEMAKKLLFYQRYGVEEYYIYDPDDNELTGFIRSEDWFQEINELQEWISPRLGIRFELTPETLEISRSDGQKFLTPVEIDQLRLQERQQKEAALQQLEQERQKYQDLITRLQEKGINPEEI